MPVALVHSVARHAGRRELRMLLRSAINWHSRNVIARHPSWALVHIPPAS
jgi:hypothetical protein